MSSEQLRITESPRDAQQGLPFTISIEKRAAYINELMLAGFDVIDFGSFVSPQAVPQMAHSGEVLQLIDKSKSDTKLLAIVGNIRGAEEACASAKLDIVGFPYSISNTFLERNINSSIVRVDETAAVIGKICSSQQKAYRVFVSMAFGNPYGDDWNIALVKDCVEKLANSGVQTITLSDTIGLATATSIREIFDTLMPLYPGIEIGLHIHTQHHNWREKISAAWKAGCRSYDGVINGIGGCPMTGYELLGNLNTLDLLSYLEEEHIAHRLDNALIKDIAFRYGTFSNGENYQK
ncbi:hydroxymethylglutaryl-CoA lyase [Niabella yanshanensis]|uniref:Hydroxymethylglutaryl-CoA lyase n=1 Tax=Niabella yanshanensis TaxID=577386 RepID=A0ABZ0W9F4_9BACT|nr:hydroxymethylglutaryl-CoA lyase [Niabella yanshanensis]WQD39766.1 hydroxymethylglutaryl-CoA lyase [Niabella yanshanensis]